MSWRGRGQALQGMENAGLCSRSAAYDAVKRFGECFEENEESQIRWQG